MYLEDLKEEMAYIGGTFVHCS